MPKRKEWPPNRRLPARNPLTRLSLWWYASR